MQVIVTNQVDKYPLKYLNNQESRQKSLSREDNEEELLRLTLHVAEKNKCDYQIDLIKTLSHPKQKQAIGLGFSTLDIETMLI